MLEFVHEQDELEQLARIKVIGVGGGGGNAVKRMIEADMSGVEFYVVNTDFQALRTCQNATKVQIGLNTTGRLGAGADPEKGRQAAEEDKDKLKTIVEGAEMVFVTAGMGGGTGTGAAPIIANLAREAGALTIGVVTRPFNFEGRQRAIQADDGLENMRASADSVIVIPNQRLFEVIDKKNVLSKAAFRMCDDILHHAVQSISNLIMVPGEINLDFADVKTVMQDAGSALMGYGIASGDNRAETATKRAISSPLLEETNIDGAMGIIVNITGPPDMMMYELEDAMEVIKAASDTEQVIFGLAYDEDLEDEMHVTVIATGFDSSRGRTGQSSQNDVVSLDDFLSYPRTDQSPVSQHSPVDRSRQPDHGRRRNTIANPRSVPESPRREFGEPERDETLAEDVLDIPTFIRYRSSENRKR
ncbi:cell division protein FtsZ [Candidatus Poribacteria bacterium]|nr:cell division protein FtsZ [Candidatus Poribacteria bacterium]